MMPLEMGRNPCMARIVASPFVMQALEEYGSLQKEKDKLIFYRKKGVITEQEKKDLKEINARMRELELEVERQTAWQKGLDF